MYKRILTSALLFGMVATGPPAAAMTCAPRVDLVDRLSTEFNERLTATGLQNARSLIEVWSSVGGDSFTILVSHPNGISCVVSAGKYWTTITPAPAPDKEGVAG